MPAWSWLPEWSITPASVELLVWGMCGIFALLLLATLAAFGAEVASMIREDASPMPAREFQGFGRAAPRAGSHSPGVV